MALVIAGLLTFPLVIVLSAPIINTFQLLTETKALISGILGATYLLLYMGLLIWYRKKAVTQLGTQIETTVYSK